MKNANLCETDYLRGLREALINNFITEKKSSSWQSKGLEPRTTDLQEQHSMKIILSDLFITGGSKDHESKDAREGKMFSQLFQRFFFFPVQL